jgi:hypothetical protein
MSNVNEDHIDSQPISDTTKMNYKNRLDSIKEWSKKPIEWIMQNPKAILKMLVGKTEKPASLAAYITAICKLYTIHPAFLSEHTAKYTQYTQILRYYTKKQNEIYETNAMPAAKMENIVPYDMILERVNEMEKDDKTFTNYKIHLRYVLFAMFLNIKPKRSDLGEVRIILNTNLIPTAFTNTNCLMLNANNRSSYLVMNKYKTVKDYGPINEKLDPKLVAILKRSIELFPRDYLFISLNGKIKFQPYTKNNSYSQYVRRAFDHDFGKTMGVSLWRHVYVGEKVDFNAESYTQLKENAKLSGQSVLSQLKIYKYLS